MVTENIRMNLPIGLFPAVTASKVTTCPTSEVTLKPGLNSTNFGSFSESFWPFLRALTISLAEPRLIEIELRIKGVTEYSVCSRSFSSEDTSSEFEEMLKSNEEATDILSESSETSSISFSPEIV